MRLFLLILGLVVAYGATEGGSSRLNLDLLPHPHPEEGYREVREAIATMIQEEQNGPILVRLAWHASGTYDEATGTGGSNGATMRFKPEKDYGANRGLEVARDRLKPIKGRFHWITYADLWTLAGAVAIEELGGPVIPWRPGRTDAENGTACPPDGRLPDASKNSTHLRHIFYRMGFNDQEIVALSGAHTLGRCHRERSGYDGPWTRTPLKFTNSYFTELMKYKWHVKDWDGPLQYEDADAAVMMLPTDMALLVDNRFHKWVKIYAKDEDQFFKDFASAFSRMLELGVPFPEDSDDSEGPSEL